MTIYVADLYFEHKDIDYYASTNLSICHIRCYVILIMSFFDFALYTVTNFY